MDIKLLNVISITLALVILLADTVPSMVLRTAVVTPAWEMGVLDQETVVMFIFDGHF